MSDLLLPLSAAKERVSVAYVTAIASLARLSTYEPSTDYDSIDLGIQSRGEFRATIEIQIKATTILGEPDSEGFYRFQLSHKNYDGKRAANPIWIG